MKDTVSKLGNKYTCYECGCKFYDLNKPEPICPKCNANQKNAEPEPKISPPKRIRSLIPVEEPEENEDVEPMGDEDFSEIDSFDDDEDIDLNDFEKDDA